MNDLESQIQNELDVADHVQKTQQLQGSIAVAKQQNPDEAVKAQDAGTTDVGMYKNMVASGYTPPDKISPQAMVTDYPKTSAAFSVPSFAATAHDDIETWQSVEKNIQSHAAESATTSAMIPQRTDALGGQMDANAANEFNQAVHGKIPSVLGQFAGTLGSQLLHLPGLAITSLELTNPDILLKSFTDPEGFKDIDLSLHHNFNLTAFGDPGKALNDFFSSPELAKDKATGYIAAFKEGGAGAVSTKIAEDAASVAPFLINGVFGLGILGAASEGAERAHEAGVGPIGQAVEALGQGGGLYVAGKLAEFGPFRYFKNVVNELTGTLSKEVAEQVVQSGLTQGIKKSLAGIWHGALAGGALSGSNALTDYITGTDKHSLDDIGTKMLDSATSWAALSVAGGIPELFHPKAAEGQKAMQDAQTRTAVFADVEKSKLFDRSVKNGSKLLQSNLEGTSLEFMHCSVDHFDEIAKKFDKDPVQSAADMGFADAYAKAKQDGTDIQFKTSEIMKHFRGTKAFEEFNLNSKSDPNGVTPKEAMDTAKQERAKASSEQAAFDASVEKVRQKNIKEQMDAGFSKETAEHDSQLFAKNLARFTMEYRRTPGKENITPEEFDQEFKLTEMTPKQMSLLEKVKQYLPGQGPEEKAERKDENGMTADQVRKVQEKMMRDATKQAGGDTPLAKFVRDNGSMRMDTLPKGELTDMQAYKLAKKGGKHHHDEMAELARAAYLLGPDEDIFEALRSEARRAENKRAGRKKLNQAENAKDPLISSYTDISDLHDDVLPTLEQWKAVREKNRQYEKELRTDRLTGLHSDKAYEDDSKAFPGWTRLSMDVDGLGRMNDTFGHDGGNALLKGIAAHLLKVEGDRSEARFYRLHGDEMAGLVRDPEQARALRDRIQNELETIKIRCKDIKTGEMYDYHGLGLSIGAGETDDIADKDLYKNKEQREAAGLRQSKGDAPGTPRRARAISTGDGGGGQEGGSPLVDNRQVGDGTSARLEQRGKKGNPRAELNILHTEGGGLDNVMVRHAESDLSSFTHELHHHILEVMDILAHLPSASDQIKEDFSKLEKWAGVEPGAPWTDEQKEMFATGGEKYLLEGKAPSVELRPVFARIQQWIRDSYKRVRKDILPQLTDEVRGVYDRVFAAPDAIAEAHSMQGRMSWMSKEGDDERVAKAKEKAHESAVSDLLNKEMADIRRRETKAWKDTYAEHVEKEKSEMLKEPKRKAEMALTGKDFDGETLKDSEGRPLEPVKLDAGKLLEMGIDVSRLPSGSVAEHGADPDSVAAAMGYQGGAKEMVLDMAQAKPFAKELEARAKAAADFISEKSPPEKVIDMAQDAVHNKDSAELMRIESNKLLKQNPKVFIKVLLGELKDEFKGKLDGVVAALKAKAAEDSAVKTAKAYTKSSESQAKAADLQTKLEHAIAELKMEDRWFRAGARKMGSLLMSNEEIKASAAEKVHAETVGDLNPNVYAAAERKARKDANDKYLKNDFEGAMAAKGQELFNHECYRAAREAQERMQDTKDYFKKFKKDSVRKQLAGATYGGFSDQINEILSNIGFQAKKEGPNKAQAKLLDWVKGMNNNGITDGGLDFMYDPQVKDWLYDLRSPKSFKEFKVSEIDDVRNSIESLEQISKDMQSLKVRNDKVALQDVVDQMKEQNGDRGQKFTGEEIKANLPKLDITGEFFKNLGRKMGSVFRLSQYSLINRETFVNRLDLQKVEGPYRDIFGDAFTNASILKSDLSAEIEGKAKEKGDELDARTGGKWRKSLNDLVSTDDCPEHSALKIQYAEDEAPKNITMTRKMMLAMSHYTGNELDMAKLCDGYGEREGKNGFTPENVMKFLKKNMSREDWESTQHHWDTFEPIREKQVDMLKRTSSFVPPSKPARSFPVDFPEGGGMNMRGGYTPVAYDHNLEGAKNSGLEVDKTEGQKMNYRPSSTSSSSTKAMTGMVGKVSLDLEASNKSLRDAIHDLAYREPLQNAIKVLLDKGFSDSLKKTYGNEAYQALVTGVKDIRDLYSHEPKDNGLRTAVSYLRKGTVMAWVSGKASTVAKELLSRQLKSVGYLEGKGFQYYAAESAHFSANPRAYIAKASEMFGEIRTRIRQMDQNLEAGHGSMYKAASAMDKMEVVAHSAFLWSDLSSSAPLAFAAYNHATMEGVDGAAPMDHEAGVNYANSIVRQSHGSALETARSNFINSKNDVAKQLATVYGFMNTSLNQQMDMMDKAVRGDFGTKTKMMGRFLALSVMPAASSMLVREGLPAAGKAAKWMTQALLDFELEMFPGANEAVGIEKTYAKWGKENISVPPSEQPFVDLAHAVDRTGHQIFGSQKKGKKEAFDYQDWANAIAEFGHVPFSGQVGKTAQVLEDYRVGKKTGTEGQEIKEAILGGVHEEEKHGKKHR
jgi:GGDEF domain-containing protein